MVTKVDIVNNALIEVGDDGSLSAVGEDGVQGETAEKIYDVVKDALLTSHLWNFATGRAALELDATSPAFEYDNQYVLPSDCLRAWKIYNSKAKWVIEGNRLLTNDSNINLYYIKEVDDPNDFSALFVDALILALAVRFSGIIGKSPTVRADLRKAAKDALREAKRRDGQEGTPDLVGSTTFIDGIKNPTGYLRQT